MFLTVDNYGKLFIVSFINKVDFLNEKILYRMMNYFLENVIVVSIHMTIVKNRYLDLLHV